MKTFAELAFTPAVRTLQERHGSCAAYARVQARAQPGEGLGSREVEHLSGVDSFYIATVSETAWPYIQHRGGPRGFLKVVDEKTLAFADYRGNRQYISVGNLAGDDRAALILMDYAGRARLKIYAQCRGRADRRRPCSCATRGRRRLQGQTRTHPAAAPHGVRLELPTAHHPAVH